MEVQGKLTDQHAAMIVSIINHYLLSSLQTEQSPRKTLSLSPPGFVNMVPIVVYSQVLHEGIPMIAQPARDKTKLHKLFAGALTFACKLVFCLSVCLLVYLFVKLRVFLFVCLFLCLFESLKLFSAVACLRTKTIVFLKQR